MTNKSHKKMCGKVFAERYLHKFTYFCCCKSVPTIYTVPNINYGLRE